jgi:hypothetical protein
MTPTEAEALLIELWNQGLEIAKIARRMGIPKSTVQSRAHRLQQRGLIQPRPKGGAYPSQRVKVRQDSTPRPVQSSVGQPPTALVPSPAVPSAAIIDLLRQTLARLDTAEQDLKAMSSYRQAVDVRFNTNAAEAQKICTGLVEVAAQQKLNFAGKWKLCIFSPYSGEHPIAVCTLK